MLGHLADAPMRLRADIVAGRAGAADLALHPAVTADLDAASALAVSLDDARLNIDLLRGGVFLRVDPAARLDVLVHAGDVATRVTGTAFAVERDADRVVVSVAEGSVTTTLAGEDWALAPRDRLSLSDAGGALSRVDREDVAAWRDDRLVAEDTPLDEIARRLDARHAGAILIADPALGRLRVTGAFRLDDPLAALRAAAAPHGGEVVTLTPWVAILK